MEAAACRICTGTWPHYRVPHEQQQFHAVMAEDGVLPVDSTTQADLAERIRGNL